MSRSKRKTPFFGMTCMSKKPSLQKKFRSQENRAKRKQVKIKLSTQDFENIPHEKVYGNEWASPRDGKMFMKNPNPEYLRK